MQISTTATVTITLFEFLCYTFCYVLIQFKLFDNILWYRWPSFLADYIRLLCLAVFSHLASHNFFRGN